MKHVWLKHVGEVIRGRHVRQHRDPEQLLDRLDQRAVGVGDRAGVAGLDVRSDEQERDEASDRLANAFPGLTVSLQFRRHAALIKGEWSTSQEWSAMAHTSPADFAATILSVLGIDPQMVLHTPVGRPIQLASGGRPVHELL